MTTGFNFGQMTGAQTAQQPAFSFGQSASIFGGPKTSASTSFTLGQGQKTTAAAPAFNLGQTNTTAATTTKVSTNALGGGFKFGNPISSQPVTNLGSTLGTKAPTVGTGTSAFSIGTKSSATASPFQFGPTTSTPSTGIGASLFSSSTSGNVFGAKTTSTAPTSGIIGGQPATTGLLGAKTTSSMGIQFGASSVAAPSTGLLGGTGSLTSALGTSTTGLGGTPSSLSVVGQSLPTTTAVLGGTSGLGGTASGLGGSVLTSTSVVGSGNTGIDGKSSDTKQLKENPLPNQLNVAVEELKKCMKEQKSLRDEISRISAGGFEKVHEEMTTLRQQLSVVSNGIQRDGFAVEKLKHEMSQELRNSEISQRINDIPVALQHEYTAPSEYFHRIVLSFEERMVLYRQQIEELESHLVSMGHHHAFTPQELTEVMQRLHDVFIALAAQLQNIHEQVKAQKEHYLNYRKAFFSDSTDIFVQPNHGSKNSSVTAIGMGPSPFSNITGAVMAAALNASNLGSNNLPQTGLATAQPSTLGLMNNNTLGTNTGLTAPAAFGSSLGMGTTGFGAGLGTTFTGFGRPGASTGFGSTGTTAFGQTGTTGFGTAGIGFGGVAKPATGFTMGSPAAATSSFQLAKPPAGGKRGKKK